jgi:hypothetical protein
MLKPFDVHRIMKRDPVGTGVNLAKNDHPGCAAAIRA